MPPSRLYCPVCGRHTPHVHHVDMYATRCLKCNTYTSQLERSHVENLSYSAPDGTAGQVVHNTPDRVTFYVAQGPHKGYYHYDKHTKQKTFAKIK